MEITTVEAIPIRRDLDERFANAQKWIDSREYCLIRVETATGLEGWGECWGPVAGNREIVESVVDPWIVGEDARDVERLHDELRFRLRSAYHSFVPASVVSGVDLALWDLRGKAAGESVARLLGGRRRDEVRAYATGHFFRDVDDFDSLCEIVAEEARAHVAAGFGALKNKIGLARHFEWGPEEDVELVATIRDAVGDDVDLMADANHAYDRATAARVGRELADLDVRFFEEPIPPEQIDGYAGLERDLDVPVAAGECWAFEEFDRALAADAVGLVQPDLTSAGGVTTTRRVAADAAHAGVQCVPHVFGSAVALAASLQVVATLPGAPMLEFDRTPNPVRDDLAVDPVTNEGDVVPIPDGPGLGVEVDRDALADLRVD